MLIPFGGVSIGAGFQLMMSGDIRILSKQTKCSILEAKWGLLPDMCLSSTSRHIIREDILKKLSYTTEFVTGNELKEFAIATILCDNEQDCYKECNLFINSILFKTPESIASIKLMLNQTIPYKSFLFTNLSEQNTTILNIEEKLQRELLFDEIKSKNQRQIIFANIHAQLPTFIVPFKSQEEHKQQQIELSPSLIANL
jgi:enoyl-CoA hydratase/carnithine racemase